MADENQDTDQNTESDAGTFEDKWTALGPQANNSTPGWVADALAYAPANGAGFPDQQGDQGDQQGAQKPAGAGSYWDDPEYQALREEGNQLRADQRTNQQEMIKDMRASREKMEGIPLPQMQQTPKAPQQKLGDGAMQYMQIAAALSALAGGLSRRGSTTALNAFAGAIKGFTQGNLEVFKQKSEEWKQAAEEVRDTNQQKLDQYKLVWQNQKTSLDQKMEEYKLIASTFHDEINYNLADRRDYVTLAQANQKEVQMQKMYEARVDEIKAQTQKLLGAAEQAKNRNDQVKEIAEAKMNGLSPPTTTGLYGLAGPVQAYMASKGFNQPAALLDWQKAQKDVQTLNGQPALRFYGLAKQTVQTMDDIQDMAAELKQGGVTLLNKANLTYQINTKGNTPIGQLATQYDAAMAFLSDELASLAQGGYAPTEPAWKVASRLAREDYGSKQLSAALEKSKQLINQRINSLGLNGRLGPGSANRYVNSDLWVERNQKTVDGMVRPTTPQSKMYMERHMDRYYGVGGSVPEEGTEESAPSMRALPSMRAPTAPPPDLIFDSKTKTFTPAGHDQGQVQ